MKHIYLAHPYFSPEQQKCGNELRTGIEGFLNHRNKKVFLDLGSKWSLLNPFKYTPAIEGNREQKAQMSKFVLFSNMELLDKSSLVIAVIDDRDQGVIWEMGYAVARKIPVISVSYKDYDTNIMLGASVLAHVPQVLSHEGCDKLFNILNSTFAIKDL